MAKGVNKVFLLGNVGKDPEIRSTAGGMQVASFSLATADRAKDAQGNWADKTEWHNIVCFQRTAEVVRDYVKKGSQILIEGKIQTRSWDDKASGEKKYKPKSSATSSPCSAAKAAANLPAAVPSSYGGARSNASSSSSSSGYDQRSTHLHRPRLRRQRHHRRRHPLLGPPRKTNRLPQARQSHRLPWGFSFPKHLKRKARSHAPPLPQPPPHPPCLPASHRPAAHSSHARPSHRQIHHPPASPAVHGRAGRPPGHRPRFFAHSPDGRIFLTDMYDRSDNSRGAIYLFDPHTKAPHPLPHRPPQPQQPRLLQRPIRPDLALHRPHRKTRPLPLHGRRHSPHLRPRNPRHLPRLWPQL